MKLIPKKKGFQINEKFFKENEEIFVKLFQHVVWPIIEPLTAEIPEADFQKFKDETWDLFYDTLQNYEKIKDKPIKNSAVVTNVVVTEFIAELIRDFSASFYEELVESKEPEGVLDSIRLLISQQIVISWINYIVENSIAPLLVFTVKVPKKIQAIKQLITRVLLAIAQELITSEEAENQITNSLLNTYNLSNELVLFIKSLIKTFGQFNTKHGLGKLAEIGEETIRNSNKKRLETYRNITDAVQDALYDREVLVSEWTRNVLYPSCIGLRIGGKSLYENFIDNCKKDFELFLDQALTAEDFEKRVDSELKKFGGDSEEERLPILESIVGSVRFLEIARIDDPSLSLLVAITEEERETARKGYL